MHAMFPSVVSLTVAQLTRYAELADPLPPRPRPLPTFLLLLSLSSSFFTGSLEAGSPTCRLEGKVVITLHGEYGSTAASDRPSLLAAATDDWHVKGIVVTGAQGSKMELCVTTCLAAVLGASSSVSVFLFFPPGLVWCVLCCVLSCLPPSASPSCSLIVSLRFVLMF